MNKNKTCYVGYWLRRFFEEHLVTERNLSINTCKSYRDTFKQLLPFVSKIVGVRTDILEIRHLDENKIRVFLRHIEQDNGCTVATRNQRLAAIHSFARYVSCKYPEKLDWCRELFNIPVKRDKVNVVNGVESSGLSYLEKNEMNDFLAAPNRNTMQGCRDYALLLFMYNSGARVTEVATLTIGNLRIDSKITKPTVVLCGKGGKKRICPLWNSTVHELEPLIKGRMDDENVFLNKYGRPITRAGIYDIVKKYATAIEEKHPAIKKKHVSPHTIRHTTASHLLESGVDINTIRAWLGHVSVDTTNIYAEVNIKMKTEALQKCEVSKCEMQKKRWKNKDIMDFLSSI